MFLTWALDVADDAAGGVVHELDADLGHSTARTCLALDTISFSSLSIASSWIIGIRAYRCGRGLW
jgi:hypothetical protein